MRGVLKPRESALGSIKLPLLYAPPIEPRQSAEQHAAAVEEFDKAQFRESQRPNLLIGAEREIPAGTVIADQAAEQAREIGRDAIAAAGVCVDQSRDFVTGEQDVIVPHVTQTGLQWNCDVPREFQLFRHGGRISLEQFQHAHSQMPKLGRFDFQFAPHQFA